MPVPLRFRIPIEYGVVMAVNVVTAWLYAAYAKADLMLALALGLAFVVGFWLLMQIYPKTRNKGIHFLTALALAVTLYAALRLAGAV